MAKTHVKKYEKDDLKPHRMRGFGSIKELDPRQRRLVQAYLDPASPSYMNKTYSAELAGYAESGKHTIMSPGRMPANVKRAIEAAMDSAGINDQLLAKRHYELLMKDEIKFNPKTLKYESTGSPDSVAVKAGLDMAYKIRGDYAPEKHITGFADLNSILEEIQNDERPIVRKD